MQEQVNTTAKKAARQVKNKVEAAVTDVETSTELSLDGLFGGLKSMLASFDQSPLAFIKANPMRATLGGFFIGLIFGAAMAKRSVTK